MSIHRTRKIIRMIMPFFGLSFMVYLFISMQARNVDEGLLESSEAVFVEQSEAYITFKPATDTSQIGFLFYPGALVDPNAYVPMVHDIAQAGYEAVIIKVPYRLDTMEWQKEAIFSNTVAKLQESGKEWVLSGHSRGARRALEFLSMHENRLAGLILIGTSHPREQDHSKMHIPVMKVYASNDGLASEAEVQQYRPNLPQHTQLVLIEGGNHAQFAWYGRQLGDEKATISREDQQAQLLEAILDFLGDH